MMLKKATKTELKDFPDEKLLSSVKKNNETIFIIQISGIPTTDPLVELEVSFQKCLRVGALRK